MSFDPEFLTLMPSTIQVRELFGVNDYGEPSYSTAVTRYRCLVQLQPTLVNNAQGEEVVSSHTAYVASTGTMNATALYTLPDGSTPALQSITTMFDEDGIHHSVLHFGGGGGG